MTVGMFLTCISFAMAGIVQLVLRAQQIHVAWQILQYAVLTCGEVLVSVSGLEFAYSQAPKTMKSVVQSFWLLSVALGNAFVAIVAEVSLFDLASEFFFFCGLMFVVTIIFMLFFVRTYNYVIDDLGPGDDGEGGRELRETIHDPLLSDEEPVDDNDFS